MKRYEVLEKGDFGGGYRVFRVEFENKAEAETYIANGDKFAEYELIDKKEEINKEIARLEARLAELKKELKKF